MADQTKTIETLKQLIKINLDGERGYREAAESIDDSSHKRTFYERSTQRASFAGELAALVRENGGEPPESGTAAASAHRTWLNLRDWISERDDKAVLKEVDRGEEVAVEAYHKALGADLPTTVKETLRKQAEKVEADHRQVHDYAHQA